MPKQDFSMTAAALAQMLARQAEAVCRHYLPAGRREGRYWLVGDVHNTPGRSLFVRLSGGGMGKGAAGRWQDAAEGTHGDLLDLIRERCGLLEFRDVAEEARQFLGLAADDHAGGDKHSHHQPHSHVPSLPGACAVPGPQADDGGDAAPDAAQAQRAARRLFGMAQPLSGTLAETYLHRRGIAAAALTDIGALRFHPRCYYRATPDSPPEPWPALIAAVTDFEGTITGVQRTWLDPDGFDPLDPIRLGKAPLAVPRRALGLLLGHAVRFGPTTGNDVLAAGEGIETMLSLRCVLPAMKMAAALSAGHLATHLLPAGLRRLYIARDADAAGDRAVASLTGRAIAAGVEAITLSPRLGDFNDDLRVLGLAELRAHLRVQLAPEDAVRFMACG
ncbi:DNA primase [Acidocella aquatica]|uniref:DNA primase n=1 Tax=Acidocella aquatica TaxID=1922313 RepID=A0ABQ6AE26_9PROT|nr:toprim domain-containing protein [Acidocella aquatica]GLR68300.1 DNA primase [Acidocella aquatica]